VVEAEGVGEVGFEDGVVEGVGDLGRGGGGHVWLLVCGAIV
jgi:hypothetical protein